MALRGQIVIECDTARCYAEIVLPASDANVIQGKKLLTLELLAADWLEDEDGLFRCPECCDPDDERGGRKLLRAMQRDLEG